MSAGLPRNVLNNVLLARHNYIEDVRQFIKENIKDIACVIMNPICHAYTQGNKPGFLEGVRQMTEEKA